MVVNDCLRKCNENKILKILKICGGNVQGGEKEGCFQKILYPGGHI